MVDQQLTLNSTDIDPKSPPGPLGSKNVLLKCSSATNSNVLKNNVHKISLSNGCTDKISEVNIPKDNMELYNTVRKTSGSASKTKKSQGGHDEEICVQNILKFRQRKTTNTNHLI